MGLGPSLPPAELARRNSVFFVEVKHLFSTKPEMEIFSKSSWLETEANGGHWGDWTRSRNDRTRPVNGSTRLARDTRASHRRVRSITGPARPVKPQRNCETREIDRTR
jgi:hypothetical protein